MSVAKIELLDSFTKAEDAMVQTLKFMSIVAAAKNPDRLMQRFNVRVPVSDARKALQKPVVVFDIDDTLLYSEGDSVFPIRSSVFLLKSLKRMGCTIYLVTARHPDYEQDTWKELKSIGVTKQDVQSPILFCDVRAREKWPSLSASKYQLRQAIALAEQSPVLLTVGDQWSDLVRMSSNQQFQAFDEIYGAAETPWMLFSIMDGTTLFGLKLRAT